MELLIPVSLIRNRSPRRAFRVDRDHELVKYPGDRDWRLIERCLRDDGSPLWLQTETVPNAIGHNVIKLEKARRQERRQQKRAA